MFKADLKARLARIFGVEKTTYDAPTTDAPEQDTLFVTVADANARLSGPDRVTARAAGFLTMFSQANRLPYGFFQKKIQNADPADARAFLFGREIDVLESPARLQNLHERRVPFTFLYDAQHDPDKGSLTSLDLSIDIQE